MAAADESRALIESMRSAFMDHGSLPRNFVLERLSLRTCTNPTPNNTKPPNRLKHASPHAGFQAPPLNTPSDALMEIVLSHNPQPLAQDAREARSEVKYAASLLSIAP